MRPASRSLIVASALAAAPAAEAADHFGGFGWYYGELHVHTGESTDGGSADLPGTCSGSCGEHAKVYSDARDNGLDFAAITDHVNGGHSASQDGFAADVALAVGAHDPDAGFISLVAGEVWFIGPDGDFGHKNLYFFGDDATIAPVTLDELRPNPDGTAAVSDCASIASWVSGLEAVYGPVLLIPHHTAALLPMPTDWSCHDPAHELAAEVYSEHGSSMGEGNGYDTLWGGEVESGTVLSALDPAGYALEMGFLGGSDKHNSRAGDVCSEDTQLASHPYGGGITIAALPEGESLSRESLYEAIVAHHTLASSGPRLPVNIRYSTGGVELGSVGDRIGVPADQTLLVEVAVPLELAGFVVGGSARSVDRVTPLTPLGVGAWGVELTPGERGEWVYVTVEVDGAAWYGAAGCNDGGDDSREFVWASPSWIDDVPDDLDGDGVSFVEGDCADGDPDTHPGAVDLPGDGLDQDCDGADAMLGAGDSGGETGALPDDSAADTAAPADSGAEPPTASAPEATLPHGCGCAAGEGVPGGFGVLTLVLALRRRAGTDRARAPA